MIKLSDFKEVFIRPQSNVAALDGMRAFAILFVFAFHFNEQYHTTGFTSTIFNKLPPFRGGWIGVPIFFVLSGFLIGGQLWKELIKTKTINFLQFFYRRSFRIWPLYYFIAILFFITGFWGESGGLKGLLSNFFFLSNFWQDTGPINGAWSLATEEQFYIITPLTLILFRKSSLASFRKILILLFFIPLLSRYITWNYIVEAQTFSLSLFMQTIYRPIINNSEGLIIGLFISNFIKDTEAKVYPFFEKRTILFAITFLLFLISFISKVYFNILGVALCSGALLWCCLTDNIVSRFMAMKIWFPFAKTSFAIYLINMPILAIILKNDPFQLKMVNPYIGFFVYLVTTLILCFISASFLYVFIEKPFLKIRNNFLL